MITVNVSGAGTFSGGFAAGVSVIEKKTEARIGADAHVVADGAGGALAVNSGTFGSGDQTSTAQQKRAPVSFSLDCSDSSKGCVDPVADRIRIPNHGLSEGEEVLYTSAGVPIAGLEDAKRYFVHVIDTNTIELRAAPDATDAVDLRDAGPPGDVAQTLQPIDGVGVPLDAAGSDDAGESQALAPVLNATQTTVGTTNRRGVVVVAVSLNQIAAAAAAAGGSGGVSGQIAAAVAVHDFETLAHVDTGAQVSAPSSDVHVDAGRSYSLIAVDGALNGAGVGSVAPAFAVPVLTGSTKAWIGDTGNLDANAYTGDGQTGNVSAGGDAEVAARAQEHLVTVAVGFSESANVAAAIDGAVIVIDTTTLAAIGGNMHVTAGGNVVVYATDDSVLYSVAGALGIGVTGGGGALGVVVTVITKRTEAAIGGGAHVDASAETAPVDVPDGSQTPGGTAWLTNGAFKSHAMRGVLVVAASSERLVSVAAALGAGTFVGFAGALTVDYVDSDTFAHIVGFAQDQPGDAFPGRRPVGRGRGHERPRRAGDRRHARRGWGRRRCERRRRRDPERHDRADRRRRGRERGARRRGRRARQAQSRRQRVRGRRRRRRARRRDRRPFDRRQLRPDVRGDGQGREHADERSDRGHERRRAPLRLRASAPT